MKKTENKILKIARELFACKSAHCVSIREIAEKAGVNVASINYHFGSKEELLIKIIDSGMSQTLNEIDKYLVEHKKATFLDLTKKIQATMSSKREEILSAYRLLLFRDDNSSQHEFWSNKKNELPFALTQYRKVLHNEMGDKISEDEVVWATHIITTQIMQLELIEHTGQLGISQLQPTLGKDYASKTITRLAEAIMLRLKTGEIK